MGLLALVAQALPGGVGGRITTPEVVAVAGVLVILVLVQAVVYWRR
jgi:hypothetical protein